MTEYIYYIGLQPDY